MAFFECFSGVEALKSELDLFLIWQLISDAIKGKNFLK